MNKNEKKNMLAIIAVIAILILIIGGIIVTASKEKEYTVVFDSKGGTVVTSQTINAGDTVNEPEDPKKEGYTFIGWYESEGANIKYDFTSKVNKNFTLIAKWEIKQTNTELKEVSIVNNKTEITVGDNLELEIKTNPENAIIDSKNVIWSSSDNTIATVDKNGKVVALKAGKVTITVKIGDITNKFELTIKEKVEVNEDNHPKTETNKNTNSNTQKPSNNTSKPNNNNPSTTSTPVTPSVTETPTVTEKPEITYSYEWIKIDTSVAGQYKLYIKSSEGKYVSGTATLTTTSGKSSTVSIPASGAVYVKDAIASVSNVKAN